MTNNIVQVYLCTTKEHLNFKNIFNYTSCTGYILYLMYNMEYRLKQTGIWHTKRHVLPSYAECANLVVLKRTKTLKKVCVSNSLHVVPYMLYMNPMQIRCTGHIFCVAHTRGFRDMPLFGKPYTFIKSKLVSQTSSIVFKSSFLSFHVEAIFTAVSK